jgi:single-strand DNA-binding protein
LSKGRKVMVVGRLQTQSWEKDGVKRQRTEIVANDINFLDRPGEGADFSPEPPAATENTGKKKDVVIEELNDDEPVNLDEIPF